MEVAIAAGHPLAPEQRGPRRLGTLVGMSVGAAAFGIYLATLAPGLTFLHFGTDGGDLIAAATTLGVPHPPGYPAYTLLAWHFSQLPLGTVAYRTNLLSALCAAGSVCLVCWSAQEMLPPHSHKLAVSAAAALSLAFSSLFWSQAVITEVYALLALCASLLWFLTIRWVMGGRDYWLWLAGLVLGIGLGNHVTLLFIVPPLLVLLWRERRRVRRRSMWPAVGLFLAGLGVYAYLPIAASRFPSVNWGNPQTWDQFVWVVTARLYHNYVLGFDPHLIAGRLRDWAAMLGDQFGWCGLVLCFAGAWIWWNRDRLFAVFGFFWAVLVAVYAFFYNAADSVVYLIPASIVLSLCWSQGACALLDLARMRGRLPYRAGLVFLVLLPLGALVSHWRQADLSGDRSAVTYLEETLAGIGQGGLVLVQEDKPTFALWYAVYAEKRRPDISIVNVSLLAQGWYREQLRRMYPQLEVPEPSPAQADPNDLVRKLVRLNYDGLRIYSVDPASAWLSWCDLVEDRDSGVYRIELGD